MSGLKVVLSNGDMSPEGYIAVAENLLLNQTNLTAFNSDGPNHAKKRVTRLQNYAAMGNDKIPTNAKVQYEFTDGPHDITKDNCKIRANVDEPGGSSEDKVRVTMPLPEMALAETESQLSYIDAYIRQFMMFWDPTYVWPDDPDKPGTPESRNKARKYILGVLMLTKCR